MEVLNYLSTLISTELFASTFLGFLSALGVEWAWASIEQRRERQELLHDIADELEANLKAINWMAAEQEMAYTDPYQTSIWDGARSSGAIASLRGYVHFYGIAGTYWLITSANHWERLRAEVYFRQDQPPQSFNLLTTELQRERDRIRREIELTLQKLRGNYHV